MHLLKVSRITRGQSHLIPQSFEIGRFSRIKEARGQAKAARNSYGQLLLDKFWEPEYMYDYQELGDYEYLFIVDDGKDFHHEVHIWIETIPDSQAIEAG